MISNIKIGQKILNLKKQLEQMQNKDPRIEHLPPAIVESTSPV